MGKREKQELVEDYRFSSEARDQFSNLTLCQILKSALAFRYDNNEIYIGDWVTILLIFFNPIVTNCLFMFLTENNFNENVNKKEITSGAKYVFKSMVVLFFEEKSF